MKLLTAFLVLFAISALGANPDYKVFRGAGGITIVSNPPTGTIVIDGSGIAGQTNGVSASFTTNVAQFYATNSTGLPAPPLSSVQFNSNGVMQGSARFLYTNGVVVATNFWDISNVKYWGALGDGATDDTAALQAALNYVRTTGNGFERNLYFPEGCYIITNSLMLSNLTGILHTPFTIRGAGYRSTIINRGSRPTFVITNSTYLTIRQLSLTGTNDGIFVTGGGQFLFEDIGYHGNGSGVVLSNTVSGVINRCKVWTSGDGGLYSCSDSIGTNGIRDAFLLTGDYVNAITFRDCNVGGLIGDVGKTAWRIASGYSYDIGIIGGVAEAMTFNNPNGLLIWASNSISLRVEGLYGQQSGVILKRCFNARISFDQAGVEASYTLLTNACVDTTFDTHYLGGPLIVSPDCTNTVVLNNSFASVIGANYIQNGHLITATNIGISGNVGIGTNSPSVRLHVRPSIAGGNYFRVDDTNGTPRLQMGLYPGVSSIAGLWLAETVPSAINYTVLGSPSASYVNGISTLYLGTGGNQQWLINSSGHLINGTDGAYDIGASGATRPRNIYVANNVTADGTVQAGTLKVLQSAGIANLYVTNSIHFTNGAPTQGMVLAAAGTDGELMYTNVSAGSGMSILASNFFAMGISNIISANTAGVVIRTNAGSLTISNSGSGFSVSGNSNQIPYLNAAGTGFNFGATNRTNPGFGFSKTANQGNGALMIHEDITNVYSLVTIGHPTLGGSIPFFCPSLAISNLYAYSGSGGKITQEMVRVTFVDVTDGSSPGSFIQTWQHQDDTAAPVRMAGIRRDGMLSLAGGIQLQGGATLTNVLYGTATLNFPSTAAGTASDLPITVAGAADGDIVSLGVPTASVGPFSGVYSAWASNGVVYVRYANNNLVTAQDPASGLFKVRVDRFQ